MPEREISFFATLIQQYGLFTVSFSVLIVSFALCVPILITWLKEGMKRRDEKRIYTVLNNLSIEIGILTRQYNESIPIGNVEIIIENFLKHHSWVLYDFIRDIIEKNDIKNERPTIEDKIKMQIFLTFKALENALVKFKYKTKGLNEFVDKSTWETQINETIIKMLYNDNLTSLKKIANIRTYLKTEFGNIHFLVMQDINKY